MRCRLPAWGRLTVVVGIGLVLVAIPATVLVVPGLAAPPTAGQSAPSVPGLTDASLLTAPFTQTTGTADEPPSSDDQTVVVDDDGQDCETPVASIQAAVEKADPGDTVVVCAGTYRESVTIETPNLTLRTYGNASIRADVQQGVRITASEVTVRGFDVRTAESAGFRVEGANGVVVRNNTVGYTGANGVDDRQDHIDGIRILGSDDTVVQNNTVFGFEDDSIEICCGKDNELEEPGPSTGNRIVDNRLSGFPGYADQAILVGGQATETVIRNNTVVDHRANTNDEPSSDQKGQGIEVMGNHTKVVGNTVTQTSGHLVNVIFEHHTEDLVIRGNELQGGGSAGIHGRAYSMRIVGNNITDNDIFGIYLDGASRLDPGEIVIHENRILNNDMGIQNGNPFGSGSLDAPIVDATRNVWDCGGPSGGLEDPETGRQANGTGDAISAGDEPGVANVRFDPFYVRTDVDCPSQMSNPTPEPTATPTSTPSPTPTASPTSTASVGSGNGGGGGDALGSGDGDTDGDGDGGTDGDGETAASQEETDDTDDTEDVTTPSPTETPTSTPSTTPTVSPTPLVEPGFGAGTWLLGVAIVLTFLAVRRRLANRGGGRDRD